MRTRTRSSWFSKFLYFFRFKISFLFFFLGLVWKFWRRIHPESRITNENRIQFCPAYFVVSSLVCIFPGRAAVLGNKMDGQNNGWKIGFWQTTTCRWKRGSKKMRKRKKSSLKNQRNKFFKQPDSVKVKFVSTNVCDKNEKIK